MSTYDKRQFAQHIVGTSKAADTVRVFVSTNRRTGYKVVFCPESPLIILRMAASPKPQHPFFVWNPFSHLVHQSQPNTLDGVYLVDMSCLPPTSHIATSPGALEGVGTSIGPRMKKLRNVMGKLNPHNATLIAAGETGFVGLKYVLVGEKQLGHADRLVQCLVLVFPGPAPTEDMKQLTSAVATSGVYATTASYPKPELRVLVNTVDEGKVWHTWLQTLCHELCLLADAKVFVAKEGGEGSGVPPYLSILPASIDAKGVLPSVAYVCGCSPAEEAGTEEAKRCERQPQDDSPLPLLPSLDTTHRTRTTRVFRLDFFLSKHTKHVEQVATESPLDTLGYDDEKEEEEADDGTVALDHTHHYPTPWKEEDTTTTQSGGTEGLADDDARRMRVAHQSDVPPPSVGPTSALRNRETNEKATAPVRRVRFCDPTTSSSSSLDAPPPPHEKETESRRETDGGHRTVANEGAENRGRTCPSDGTIPPTSRATLPNTRHAKDDQDDEDDEEEMEEGGSGATASGMIDLLSLSSGTRVTLEGRCLMAAGREACLSTTEGVVQVEGLQRLLDQDASLREPYRPQEAAAGPKGARRTAERRPPPPPPPSASGHFARHHRQMPMLRVGTVLQRDADGRHHWIADGPVQRLSLEEGEASRTMPTETQEVVPYRVDDVRYRVAALVIRGRKCALQRGDGDLFSLLDTTTAGHEAAALPPSLSCTVGATSYPLGGVFSLPSACGTESGGNMCEIAIDVACEACDCSEDNFYLPHYIPPSVLYLTKTEAMEGNHTEDSMSRPGRPATTYTEVCFVYLLLTSDGPPNGPASDRMDDSFSEEQPFEWVSFSQAYGSVATPGERSVLIELQQRLSHAYHAGLYQPCDRCGVWGDAVG